MAIKHYNIGDKVGNLTVIGPPVVLPLSYSHTYTYLCRCVCGKEYPVTRSGLKNITKNKSCGCQKKTGLVHIPVGTKIGNLTVIGSPIADKSVQDAQVWFYPCQCVCGKKLEVIRSTLMNCGPTKSCGCVDLARRYKHGGCNTRLYGIWKAMRRRCSVPHTNGYKWYGNKGIIVCKEWFDFGVFQDWALSHGYTDSLSIDRIDSNGNYEPNNCRWITLAENVRRSASCKYYPLPIPDICSM